MGEELEGVRIVTPSYEDWEQGSGDRASSPQGLVGGEDCLPHNETLSM